MQICENCKVEKKLEEFCRRKVVKKQHKTYVYYKHVCQKCAQESKENQIKERFMTSVNECKDLISKNIDMLNIKGKYQEFYKACQLEQVMGLPSFYKYIENGYFKKYFGIGADLELSWD